MMFSLSRDVYVVRRSYNWFLGVRGILERETLIIIVLSRSPVDFLISTVIQWRNLSIRRLLYSSYGEDLPLVYFNNDCVVLKDDPISRGVSRA